MEFEENIEEDCTEELKSDDPNLKINAVSKVSEIATILEPKRTREEFIPYLIEIIEECDNDDEFLLILSEQICKLKSKIGGEEHIHLLVAPLEILSSMEETSVREKAISCLTLIAEGLDDAFFQKHFLQMLKQLSAWENYPSRISACSLLPICYPHLSEQDQSDLRAIFKELSIDDTPMVRRAAAICIPSLVSLFSQDQVKEILLPVWQKLMKDDNDSVKIKAVECCVGLAKALPKQQVAEQFLELMRNCDPEKRAWRIRYALCETLPNILPFLEQQIIRNQVLIIFEELLSDSEQEVKSIGVLQIPNLCTNLDENTIKSRILPVLKNLASDSSQHVRQSVAQTIIKISKNMPEAIIIENIFPIVQQICKDEQVDVKIQLFEGFSEFHKILGNQNVVKYLIPLILSSEKELNWRARLCVMNYLPALCELLPFPIFQEHLADFIKKSVLDHYFSIREKAIQNFNVYIKTYGFSVIQPLLQDCIRSLQTNQNYLFRISALQALVYLKDSLNVDNLNTLSADIFGALYNDPISNVRLNVIKAFQQIPLNLFKADNKKQFQSYIKKLTLDCDIDVAFYAAQMHQHL